MIDRKVWHDYKGKIDLTTNIYINDLVLIYLVVFT